MMGSSGAQLAQDGRRIGREIGKLFRILTDYAELSHFNAGEFRKKTKNSLNFGLFFDKRASQLANEWMIRLSGFGT